MGGLVAAATTVLHLSGRVVLAFLLAAFLLAYAALGLLFTAAAALVLGAVALPRRLRALGRLAGRLRRPMLAAARDGIRLAKRKLTGGPWPWTMPPT